MKTKQNQSTSLSDQIADTYGQVSKYWQEVVGRSSFIPVKHQTIYEDFLNNLSRLQDEPFLNIWASSMGEPIIALGLLDLDGDGEEELLAVSNKGFVNHFRSPNNPEPLRLPGGQLPDEALPVVGFQVIRSLLDFEASAYLVTGNPTMSLLKPFYTPSDKLEFDARRSNFQKERYLTIGQHFGELKTDGLLRVSAVLPLSTEHPRLVGNSFDLGPDIHELEFWPTALVNTSHVAWLGDSAERITCWKWHEGRLTPDPDWPQSGVPVVGRITAMTLWRQSADQRDDYHLLVATDERLLFVIDALGEEVARISLPYTLTAMIADPNGLFLFVAFDDNCLACLEPIHYALNPNIPPLDVAFDLLSTKERPALWSAWLEKDDPQLVRAAITGLVYDGVAGNIIAQESLASLANSETFSDNIRQEILESLERSFLIIDREGIETLLSAGLKTARVWHPDGDLFLRRRIDLFTARLVTRFWESIRTNPDYQWLRKARRQTDQERARDDLKRGHALPALAQYGKNLVERRELTWLFATRGSIRAIIPISEHPQTLLATRAGQLHLYDLTKHSQVDSRDLPDGAIPSAVTVGCLNGKAKDTIALVTNQGNLFLGPAIANDCLKKLEQVAHLDGDVWGVVLFSNPARLVAGNRGGQLTQYKRISGGHWQQEWQINLEAERLHTLGSSIMELEGEPVIFAGGGGVGGQGVLYCLKTGGQEVGKFTFPDVVLGVRTVREADSAEKLISVACNDGYLYLINMQGTLKWHYRVGRTVQNITVCDIDEDGESEIIIGGEVDDQHSIIILNAKGAVEWVIPVEAPVTHIATALDEDKRPILLVADLENVLRGIQVISPRGKHEKIICDLAEECLVTLSKEAKLAPESLIEQWWQDNAQSFLQGYAFYHMAKQTFQGSENALNGLLQSDVTLYDEVVQRAYARILVNLATMIPKDEARRWAARERLLELIQNEQTRQQVGVAALRQLLLPDNLQGQALTDWIPFLEEAASHSDPEVQRAVLYALRELQPVLIDEVELAPEILTVLQITFKTAGMTHDSWVRKEMVALVRDLASDDTTLWALVHYVLGRVADAADLDNLLKGIKHLMLDNRPLAQAIVLLIRLHGATQPETAQATLAKLINRFDEAFPETHSTLVGNSTPKIYIEIYRLLREAYLLETFEAWVKFVNDTTPSGGLGRLADLVGDHRIANDPELDRQLAKLREQISTLQNVTDRKPETLGRFMDRLIPLTERLNHLSEHANGTGGSSPVLFYQALSGLLCHWRREKGPLQAELDRLTAPASPQLELISAFRRDDKISLDVRIFNRGYQYAFEDFRVLPDQTSLTYQGDELYCELEYPRSHRNLVIEPRSNADLRLTAILPATTAGKKEQRRNQAMLSLYFDYFLPPKTWHRAAKLIVEVEVNDRTHVRLDWERDFPTQTAVTQQRIEQEFRQHSNRPILVEVPPLVRHGLVATIRHLPGSGPEVDMRKWRFQQQRLGDDLRASDAALLAWFAEQLWPNVENDIAASRGADAAAFTLQQLTEKQRPLPKFVILNNWERLLFQLFRSENQWQTLARVLPFLLKWARENGVRLVFIGTYLMEEILHNRWPQLFSDIVPIRCDQLSSSRDNVQAELEQAIESILREETLRPLSDRFSPKLSASWLANWCGGYLQVLDFVCLHALDEARKDPPPKNTDLNEYLFDFARRTNFYNSLWLWQSFFDKVAILLVAHGEIPIERRDWIQPGMTLSRDYYARTQDGQLVSQPTLPAGHTLAKGEETTIRSNRHYQRYDAYIQGFNPGRFSPEDTPVGRLLQQLLTVGGGRERLDRLVEKGILRRQSDRRLGDYYEIGVPGYGRWLRHSNVWQHLQRSLVGQEENWFPTKMAHNQQTDDSDPTRRWLFPVQKPGAALKDIPIDRLPAIDQALTPETKEYFYNFFGLSRQGKTTAADRWQALVRLADQLNEWRQFADEEGTLQINMRPFFESLEILLQVKRLENSPEVDNIPDPAGVRIFRLMVDLFSTTSALQQSVLLAVVRRGNDLAERAADFRLRVQKKLADWHKRQEPGLKELEYTEMMERSVVICLAASGANALRRALPPGRGGPHFVFLDLFELTTLTAEADPARALINQTFQTIGRQPFSPYKLYGSLDKGSSLFVGRSREVNAILTSLESEDHAILGSRRIGKTSLLHHLYHLLGQREASRRPIALSLNLQDASSDLDFYHEIRSAIRTTTSYGGWVQNLSIPAEGYTDLLDLMQRLYRERNHPVVLLIDEIDGLYLWDKNENEQRFFQFLRNKLAQPRLCSLVMTGYRYIFLERLKVSSVFHNFCRFHNLLAIEPEGVALLVALLRQLDLEIQAQDTVVGLIEKGTYGVPYYVQWACDRLLNRADWQKRHVIGPEDVEAILEGDIQRQLKQELWDDLLSEALPLDARLPGRGNESVQVRNLKIKVLLLATVLELYQHQYKAGVVTQDSPTFSAEDMVTYVTELCPELCPKPWKVTEEEVQNLMIPVTMTLALTPVEVEASGEYYRFPNDILPDVLFSVRRQRPEVDPLNEMITLSQNLRQRLI